MSLHWSCFIVHSCLEICSFIAILVCLSLFHSVYAQKNTKTKKNKKNKKQKQKEEKKTRKEKNNNKCAHICVQYKHSLSSYVDL